MFRHFQVRERDLKGVDVSGKYLVSYDVQSLFTNIPLEETLDIAVETLIQREPNINISRKNLKKLF